MKFYKTVHFIIRTNLTNKDGMVAPAIGDLKTFEVLCLMYIFASSRQLAALHCVPLSFRNAIAI